MIEWGYATGGPGDNPLEVIPVTGMTAWTTKYVVNHVRSASRDIFTLVSIAHPSGPAILGKSLSGSWFMWVATVAVR